MSISRCSVQLFRQRYCNSVHKRTQSTKQTQSMACFFVRLCVCVCVSSSCNASQGICFESQCTTFHNKKKVSGCFYSSKFFFISQYTLIFLCIKSVVSICMSRVFSEKEALTTTAKKIQMDHEAPVSMTTYSHTIHESK